MANRSLLGHHNGQFMFRLSRAGFNVLDMNLAKENLAFDSRWGEVSSHVLSGEVALPRDTVVRVNYGRTLPHVPVVIYMFRYANGGYLQNPAVMNRSSTTSYIEFHHTRDDIVAVAYSVWMNSVG